MLRGSLADNLRSAWTLLREKGLFSFLSEDGRDFWDRLLVQCRARHHIRAFQRLYFHAAFDLPARTWRSSSWLGVPLWKCPTDLLVYQEILYETRPEVVIETGTAAGGTALFFATLADLLGQGEVITVDIEDMSRVQHPRVARIIGSSTDPTVIDRIDELVRGRPAMVVLDSDHNKGHVLRELEAYSRFVPVGYYLIVEDTIINGHPVGWKYGEGPTEAIREFLCDRGDFIVDLDREKHLLTFNPGGYLRRIRPAPPER